MNWEAIGVVGEVVGGGLVLASLIHLAEQIRQTNRLAEAEATGRRSTSGNSGGKS